MIWKTGKKEKRRRKDRRFAYKTIVFKQNLFYLNISSEEIVN